MTNAESFDTHAENLMTALARCDRGAFNLSEIEGCARALAGAAHSLLREFAPPAESMPENRSNAARGRALRDAAVADELLRSIR